MLEVIFLAKFGRTLADMCRSKGRSVWWAAMGVGGWIFGEAFGVIVGTIIGLDIFAYAAGLGCAALCAAIGYFAVRNLESVYAQVDVGNVASARPPSGAPASGLTFGDC